MIQTDTRPVRWDMADYNNPPREFYEGITEKRFALWGAVRGWSASP